MSESFCRKSVNTVVALYFGDKINYKNPFGSLSHSDNGKTGRGAVAGNVQGNKCGKKKSSIQPIKTLS